MPAPRQIPDNATLLRWIEEGLTHRQITERIYAETGVRVSRSTVSAALHRAGLTTPQARYARELPWKVKAQHAAHYPARMLRCLGRVRAGTDMPDDERERFNSWWAWIVEEKLVVAYDPDSQDGFFYVRNELPTDCPDGTPIRPGYFPYTNIF